jgi:hypothetical protein
MKNGQIFIAAVAAIASFALLAAPASAGIDDVETPTVEGPITGPGTAWGATDKPLGQYGYVEEEYFYEGDAFRYDRSGGVEVDGTRLTTGGPDDDGRFPYRTRMIVRRPANPADFNGTAVVEWQNVTAQFDLEANWYGDPEYLLDNGYAYVAVSAQRVGVSESAFGFSLKQWNPARYGELNLPNGNPEGTPSSEGGDSDALSFDVYAAAIKALLGEGDGVDPLGPLAAPETVIASGESQSGGRLSAYYNKVQGLHDLVDAFLITVSGGEVRDDRDEPVIRVMSETENRRPLTEPDSDRYRHWEVAGGSHLPRMAFENFIGPVQRDLGLELSAGCERYPLSRVQWPFVVNAAYEHLVRWADDGPAPPIAPRGVYQGSPSDPNDQLVRNQLGIAEGGIRLPEMSVPARVNTGINDVGPGGGLFSPFCRLLGSTEDLPDAAVLGLYGDFGDYMSQVIPATQRLVNERFLLAQDMPRLLAMHRQVPNVRPTEPRRSAGHRVNKGNFQLVWRGTQDPAGSFELQGSEDGGESWEPVAGANALPGGELEFNRGEAAEGRWNFRVRSNTIVPADAVRDEFTITTPWSERSERIVVDNTKPRIRVRCPNKVKRGKRRFARFSASDAIAGLKKRPPKRKRIRTGKRGRTKVTATAIDNAGNRRKAVCRVRVR